MIRNTLMVTALALSVSAYAADSTLSYQGSLSSGVDKACLRQLQLKQVRRCFLQASAETALILFLMSRSSKPSWHQAGMHPGQDLRIRS